MSGAPSYDPRANQKQRTRIAIVEAAMKLLKAGVQPTVPEAAEEAKVSRATAYRYFPTQEALLLEAATVTPPVAEVDRLFDADPSRDPEERLATLLDAATPIFLREEATMRTALRTYLDAWFEARRRGDESPAVREGRRTRWIEEALRPADHNIDQADADRLRAALALTVGIEPVIVMKDVCGLGDEETREVLRWAAAALLRQALAEQRPKRSPRKP